MGYRTFQVRASAFIQLVISATAIALLLVSCGGGHNGGDTNSSAPLPSVTPVAGPDSFLLYPNPQSSPMIDSLAYAQAYYAAIDPNNAKDTLAKWKAANGFGNPNLPASEVQAVFGDMRDLGYGRYVTGRKNPDGTIAIYVDNYLVWTAAGYGYSSMNLDAAVARDQRWYIGTNAIEVSPGPGCTGAPNSSLACRSFAKFYTFDAGTGARSFAADLDGRGLKYMPGICMGCHGGRGDSLTPADASGKQLFPAVGNPATSIRGDVKGKLHFFEPDVFGFSKLAGYTRPDQEAAIKSLNKIVLCSFPLPLSASGVAITSNVEDTCRTPALLDEWQGGAADVIKAAYGGDGLPNPAYVDNYVPASWVVAGQTSLYQNVVQPNCRMCHILRGVGQQSDNAFSTYTAFQSAADRIKVHVLDRGNMPMTKVLYKQLWATPNSYNPLYSFLQASNPAFTQTILQAGSFPQPGRPIADAGPNRTVGTASTNLTAAASLYADTYTWSIVSNPSGVATLSNLTGSQTTLNAPIDGTYVVQLVASKGLVQSDPAQVSVVVNSNTWPTSIWPLGASAPIANPLPAAIRFADIKAVLQHQPAAGTSKSCISCHIAAPIDGSRPPPILYSDIDRNGDGVVASGVSGIDDKWLYAEVRSRINFSDISASPLLRRPSGYDHFGGLLAGFGVPASGVHADALTPGDINRSYFDMFQNWILNGAPY